MSTTKTYAGSVESNSLNQNLETLSQRIIVLVYERENIKLKEIISKIRSELIGIDVNDLSRAEKKILLLTERIKI